MSLDHILLGLLQTPASGYDLKETFDTTIRYFWAAELSQIYTTLQRLERNGLLRSKVEPSAKGPDRKVYAVTPAGRKELKKWLLDEPQFGQERFGYLAQIYFLAAAKDLERTLLFFTDLKRTLVERLRTFRQIESEWQMSEEDWMEQPDSAMFHAHLALRSGIHTMQARVRWCDEAVDRINQRMKIQASKPKARKRRKP